MSQQKQTLALTWTTAAILNISRQWMFNKICGNKMPTSCNRWFLFQILLFAQHVSGTNMPIIRGSRVLYRWLLPVVFGASAPHHTDNLKTKAPNITGRNHLYNTLELLMMGILVPETCWASNKICNKNHLLQLVGILFPHINDDARPKPHQI
jgi:hypothetical protein